MNRLTRREVLGSAGLVAGLGLVTHCAADRLGSDEGGANPPARSPFIPLDKASVAHRAYQLFPEGACMYASFASVVFS
jgi:hypothetical protein